MTNGYRLNKNGKKNGKLRVQCAKATKYVTKADPNTHESKRRKTSSQLTNCPFKFKIKPLQADDEGQWQVELFEGPSATHNHGWIEPVSFAATRTQSLRSLGAEVVELANSGVRPAQILAKIHAKDLGVIRKDVHNLIQRHRQGELKGRSPLQTLYEDFLVPAECEYVWRDTRDNQNHVTSLTIAPKTGLDLLRRNPDVLLLDATYKTNCHNMPMFNACGVTSGNKTFNWAVTFLSGERESHYNVALSAMASILKDEGIQPPGLIVSDRELALLNAFNKSSFWKLIPHLLCKWHVNMNVLAKTRRFFPPAVKQPNGKHYRHPRFQEFLKEWNALLAANTEESFTSTLASFKDPGRHPGEAVAYAVKTWIDPWKEKLVAYWVNQIPHMGHVTTSAVESSHSTIKKYLISSKADLKSVFSRLCLFWKNQRSNLDVDVAQGSNKVRTDLNSVVYNWIRGQISPFALGLLAQEVAALPTGNVPLLDSTCTCSLPTTHGLPCRHSLHKHITDDKPLELKQIHLHWWLYRATTSKEYDQVAGSVFDIPLNPLKVKGKGRPVGAIASRKKGEGINSTKRELSCFEYELRDELATAIPSTPPSTAPPALQGTKETGAFTHRNRMAKRACKPSLEPELPAPRSQATQAMQDCTVVAVTSNPDPLTSTQLGLQRLQVAGEDSYEAGTAPPRVHQRVIDGLETVDAKVEDLHDALLKELEVEERASGEDNDDPAAIA